MKVAQRACSAAARIHPQSSSAHLWLGQIHLRRRKSAKAAAAWRTAIQLDPDLGPAWIALAKTYRRMKKPTLLRKLCAEFQKRFSRRIGTGPGEPPKLCISQ